MWLPLLPDPVYQMMKQEGLEVSKDFIYSDDQPSIKDAIVIFGGGCTGSFISERGLVLTNHHCGYRYIQQLSSVEKNYLEEGYVARNQSQELPAKDLSVRVVHKIMNVTDSVLNGVEPSMPGMKRDSIIHRRIIDLEDNLRKTSYDLVDVKPINYGMSYYLFHYKEYKDVRLVLTPPSFIGKFGGSTDNWMWPRHSGDFSIFRVYAGPGNQPADYNPENKPFTPKKAVDISLSGVQENDFTWLYGFPGSTHQFYTSHIISFLKEEIYPQRIHLRTMRINTIKKEMEKSEKVNIQYAAKLSSISNSWKKWKGIITGLERANAIETKKSAEDEFIQWAEENSNADYKKLMPAFKTLYDQYFPYEKTRIYYYESLTAIELIDFIKDNYTLLSDLMASRDSANMSQFEEKLKDFHKDYQPHIDLQIGNSLIQAYLENIPEKFYPSLLTDLKDENDISGFVENMLNESIFNDPEKLLTHIREKKDMAEMIEKDPAYDFYLNAREMYFDKIYMKREEIQNKIDSAYRIYVKALKQKNPSRIFYHNANFTPRITFGQVSGFSPQDAVVYDAFTTLEGVVEKFETGEEEYEIDNRLLNLYREEDYEKYGDERGMNVNFIASNHTSGGNSGSPVFNSKGKLVGLNFDRCWESTMSDLFYDVRYCRNISVDIQYIIFIIEQYGKASYLTDEMNILSGN